MLWAVILDFQSILDRVKCILHVTELIAVTGAAGVLFVNAGTIVSDLIKYPVPEATLVCGSDSMVCDIESMDS